MTRSAFFIAVFSLSLTGVLQAARGHAQSMATTPVRLKAGNISLAELLGEVEKQCTYTFSYEPAIGEREVHLADNEQLMLDKLIALLEKQQKLVFTPMGRMIAVNRVTKPTKPGRITGKVIDEKGEALPGATLRVEETGQGVQSAVDGTYSLSLQPGTYTLSVSFISYQTQRVTGVVVGEDKIVYLNVALKLAASSLKEVVITSNFKKASIEGLYARQKNAAGITDGISAEEISRTPDKNIGETLKRISGLSTLDNKYVVVRGLSERYNQAMLNGQVMPSTELNRRNFSYDLIPTSLVDNVTVTKSLTPDQSAEFGGGLVQVNTREIPDENSLSVSFGSSVNDQTTGTIFRSPKLESANYFASMPASRELFGNGNWKSRADIVNSGYFNPRANPNDDAILRDPGTLPNNWGLYKYKPLPGFNGQLSVAHVFPLSDSKKLGVFASATYRDTWQTQGIRMSRDGYALASDGGELVGFNGNRYSLSSNVGGMAGIGYTDPNNKVSLQSILLKTSNNDFVFGTGFHDVTQQSAGYYDLYSITNLWQSQLKSEHKLGSSGLKANFALSYTRLDRQKPDNKVVSLQYAGTGNDTPLNPDADFTVTQAASSLLNAGAMRSWNRALENNLGWNADLSLPYQFKLGSLQATNVLKGGYAGWSKDRLFWVLMTGSKSYFSNGRTAPLSEVFEPGVSGSSIYESHFGDDFHKRGSLQAGYLMSDNKLGSKLRLVWGVRAEYYNINSVSAVIDQLIKGQSGRGDLTDYSEVYKQEPAWNFFPSANLTYSLTPKMNLRFSYSKSIIRPDLRELSFFREYDFELGGLYESDSPIRSTKIDNFDLRYEWYPSAGEVISVSGFYKKLRHPMEIFTDLNGTFELRNDYDAQNKGIEVELRRSFAFTGIPVLKNLTVFGNATRLFAKVRTMDIDYATDPANPHKLLVVEKPWAWQNRPQAGASNYIANAGLAYDQGGFSATASYNYISNRFYRAGQSFDFDLYEQPMQPLDAQIAVRLLKNKAMIKLSASNLLGSKYVVYNNRFSDPEVQAGRKQSSAKDLLYDKGLDFIDYEATPGRTYSLTFNYNF